MTEKRYKRLVSSIDYYYCIDTNDDKGLTEEDMLNRLNEQDETIKELEKENEQLKSTNMEMEDCIGRLKEEKIKLEIKLDLIRNYAVIGGEVKQELIENIVVDENHNMIIDKLNGLSEENEQLKDFIRKISTNNEIILANGTIYKIDKVIK